MNYAKALAMCGATLIAAVSLGTTASQLHARPLGKVTVTAPPRDVYARTVGYADLNLASLSGQQALGQRVRLAVSGVCKDAVGQGYPSDVRDCSFDSWTRAHPQMTAAIHRARDIAANGSSPIAAAAITIQVGD
jgi:UrcA family protein